jgi:hypothetical protein
MRVLSAVLIVVMGCDGTQPTPQQLHPNDDPPSSRKRGDFKKVVAGEIVMHLYAASELEDASFTLETSAHDGRTWFLDEKSVYRMSRRAIQSARIVEHREDCWDIICIINPGYREEFGAWVERHVGGHIAICPEADDAKFVLAVLAPLGGMGLNFGPYSERNVAEAVLGSLAPAENSGSEQIP